jgi:hypothetical protein
MILIVSTALMLRRESDNALMPRAIICGSVGCLDAPLPPAPNPPKGFRLAGVRFDLSGECPDCARTYSRTSGYSQGLSVLL